MAKALESLQSNSLFVLINLTVLYALKFFNYGKFQTCTKAKQNAIVIIPSDLPPVSPFLPPLPCTYHAASMFINSWPILSHICPQPRCSVLHVWIHLTSCFLSWTYSGGDPGCQSVSSTPSCVPRLENTSNVTFYYTWGETLGVLVAGRTKGQLCCAAHKLGHLWRLSSNSQLIFRKALIMPSTVLT